MALSAPSSASTANVVGKTARSSRQSVKSGRRQRRDGKLPSGRCEPSRNPTPRRIARSISIPPRWPGGGGALAHPRTGTARPESARYMPMPTPRAPRDAAFDRIPVSGASMLRFDGLARKVVDSPSEWGDVAAASTAVILIRTVLELLLDSDHRVLYYGGTYPDAVTYASAFISWICTFAALGLVARAFLGLSNLQTARLVCAVSPVTWIVPVFDWIVTRGAGAHIYYARDWSTFLHDVTQLFNPFAHVAMAPPGVRLEIFLVCAGALALSPLAFGLRLGRALGFAGALYATIFALGYLPV